MTTYTVKASRAGDWWAVSAPEVPGAFTQARRLTSVPAMAREAIALVLDTDPSSFDIAVEIELNDRQIAEAIQLCREKTRQAEASRDEAARATRLVVRELLQSGLTQREAAVVLDVSPQRLHQLVVS